MTQTAGCGARPALFPRRANSSCISISSSSIRYDPETPVGPETPKGYDVLQDFETGAESSVSFEGAVEVVSGAVEERRQGHHVRIGGVLHFRQKGGKCSRARRLPRTLLRNRLRRQGGRRAVFLPTWPGAAPVKTPFTHERGFSRRWI
ncbi:MAG: hypothetical protein ACLRSW_05530 [Christensenellaceae bacterium]